jgi:hypothetical protein
MVVFVGEDSAALALASSFSFSFSAKGVEAPGEGAVGRERLSVL